MVTILELTGTGFIKPLYQSFLKHDPHVALSPSDTAANNNVVLPLKMVDDWYVLPLFLDVHIERNNAH